MWIYMAFANTGFVNQQQLCYIIPNTVLLVSFICSPMSVKLDCSRHGRTQTEGLRAEGKLGPEGGEVQI